MHVYLKKILHLIKSSLDLPSTLSPCLVVSFDKFFLFLFVLLFACIWCVCV